MAETPCWRHGHLLWYSLNIPKRPEQAPVKSLQKPTKPTSAPYTGCLGCACLCRLPGAVHFNGPARADPIESKLKTTIGYTMRVGAMQALPKDDR